MSYETADSQKEEFRKYLEWLGQTAPAKVMRLRRRLPIQSPTVCTPRKNGIISQLTRVLVGLYEEPERPANAAWQGQQ